MTPESTSPDILTQPVQETLHHVFAKSLCGTVLNLKGQAVKTCLLKRSCDPYALILLAKGTTGSPEMF